MLIVPDEELGSPGSVGRGRGRTCTTPVACLGLECGLALGDGVVVERGAGRRHQGPAPGAAARTSPTTTRTSGAPASLAALAPLLSPRSRRWVGDAGHLLLGRHLPRRHRAAGRARTRPSCTSTCAPRDEAAGATLLAALHALVAGRPRLGRARRHRRRHPPRVPARAQRAALAPRADAGGRTGPPADRPSDPRRVGRRLRRRARRADPRRPRPHLPRLVRAGRAHRDRFARRPRRADGRAPRRRRRPLARGPPARLTVTYLRLLRTERIAALMAAMMVGPETPISINALAIVLFLRDARGSFSTAGVVAGRSRSARASAPRCSGAWSIGWAAPPSRPSPWSTPPGSSAWRCWARRPSPSGCCWPSP